MGGTSSAPTSRRQSTYPGHRTSSNNRRSNNLSYPAQRNGSNQSQTNTTTTNNNNNNNNNASRPTPRRQPSSTSSSGVQTMSQPGAYTIAPPSSDPNNSNSSTPQVYRVTVPPHVQPNSEFQVYAGSRIVRVRCPANARPGSVIQISVSPQSGTGPRAGGRDELGELQQSAVLTSAYDGEGGGGAQRMTSEIRLFNDEQFNQVNNDDNEQLNRQEAENQDDAPPPQQQQQQQQQQISPPSSSLTDSNSSQPTQYNVTVPSGVQPGTNFPVRIGSSTIQVQCPTNARPGSVVRFTAQTPATATDMHRPPPTAPSDAPSSNNDPPSETIRQTFEVTVPEGVTPGRSFALMAGGQRVLVNCPSNVRPGQRIRFSLPLQRLRNTSNNTQSNSGKRKSVGMEMKYDVQDGWSRITRVTDMKFTWIRTDEDGKILETTTSDDAAVDLEAINKRAWVRNIYFLKGNDERLGTGKVSLIPASESLLASTLTNGDLDDPGLLYNRKEDKDADKELVDYAELSNVLMNKTFEEKVNWFQTTCREKLQIPWEQGHLRIAVRRSHLLIDSVDAVMSLSPRDLRKVWRIDFLGEEGIDAGGLAKEFFELVTKEIFDADNGLWLSANADNQMAMRINPASELSCPEDHLVYFRFLGRMMGRAMFGGYFIGGHMVQYLYKHILGWPVTFADLENVDSELYSTLKNVMEMDKDQVEYLCCDFTVTEERMGAKEVVELIDNGKDVNLTGDNRVEYLEEYLKYAMFGRIKLQLTELLLGFYDVVPQTLLTVFDFQELELVLCGLPEIDLADWRKHTIYKGTFEREKGNHRVCKWFWDVVEHDFDRETKARLLQFVTGTSGVPTRGFEVLQGGDGNIKKFTIQGVALKTALFPRAHTCFNRIDLPMYNSKTDLREKLKIAVTKCGTGFTME